MAFGINGSDPFKSYQSNADAGGGMGVYARRGKKDDDEKDKKDDEDNIFEPDDTDEEQDIDIDLSDDSFLG